LVGAIAKDTDPKQSGGSPWMSGIRTCRFPKLQETVKGVFKKRADVRPAAKDRIEKLLSEIVSSMVPHYSFADAKGSVLEASAANPALFQKAAAVDKIIHELYHGMHMGFKEDLKGLERALLGLTEFEDWKEDGESRRNEIFRMATVTIPATLEKLKEEFVNAGLEVDVDKIRVEEEKKEVVVDDRKALVEAWLAMGGKEEDLTRGKANFQDWKGVNEVKNGRVTRLDWSGSGLSGKVPAALSGLTQLTWLHFHENQIIDVAPLSGLTLLTYLDLHENQIIDVAPLSGLTQLTTLRLENNKIIDVAPLSGLTQLTTLTLSNNKIIDVAPLSGLTQLTYLGLENNQIIDGAALSGLEPGCYISS